MLKWKNLALYIPTSEQPHALYKDCLSSQKILTYAEKTAMVISMFKLLIGSCTVLASSSNTNCAINKRC